MEWYQYLSAFFSGAFLANVLPHFVHGISGNKFPSPFSEPRGIGLSSPPLNMIWALVNLAIGWVLFVVAGIDGAHLLSEIIFFAGISVMGIWLSFHFQNKHSD